MSTSAPTPRFSFPPASRAPPCPLTPPSIAVPARRASIVEIPSTCQYHFMYVRVNTTYGANATIGPGSTVNRTVRVGIDALSPIVMTRWISLRACGVTRSWTRVSP